MDIVIVPLTVWHDIKDHFVEDAFNVFNNPTTTDEQKKQALVEYNLWREKFSKTKSGNVPDSDMAK